MTPLKLTFLTLLMTFAFALTAYAQVPVGTDMPICCGETCSAERPCCDRTVCSSDGRCVPEVCESCGSAGCNVNFLNCSGACMPPACCGESCDAVRTCCDGTVCSEQGRCVPANCTSCGTLGCLVDYEACTGSCAQPDCCLDPCTTSAHCCAGTICRELNGVRQCVPETCADCRGETPSCRVNASCQAECGPPERCGQACSNDGDCGTGLQCYAFSTNSRCVPLSFEDDCRRCGASGCNFNGRDCDVGCNPD